ncbi:MAG: class I SAM-dependent methyltransferase [Planctomycetes bacterium]|nr:class I SAM-dependent methyltransferase [Planctomycetota bacterium]
MQIMTTTLWEYPSQHYEGEQSRMQGDKRYVGASPSWVIWQCLQRYTKLGDVVLDPMVGSGTTIDVSTDLGRRGVGFDLAPSRPDIRQGDARKIDLPSASVDFAFIDPPYSTHVDYSDEAACIGKLDALGPDGGRAYYEAMRRVIREIVRVLKPGKYMALYVSDSYSKPGPNARSTGFAPIGFELFAMMREALQPVDIIAVVRHNQKLQRGNWHKAAEEGNFFLRGFNYLFIMRKPL